MNSIPKIIHYCWLGRKEKPTEVMDCIKSWEKYLPDYEIIEWNEDNFPFDQVNSQYVLEAIENKRWAFVTDYMRLYALYHTGGVYMDTDMEIIKNLDVFLSNKSFLSYESNYTLCTGLIGAAPKQEWILDLLNKYDQRVFVLENNQFDIEPNSKYILNFLVDNYGLTKENNGIKKLENGLVVYCSEYFSPKNFTTKKMQITENTYAIHHYNGTWKTKKSKVKDYLVFQLSRIIGEENIEKIKSLK